MKNLDILEQIQSISTWRLSILSLLTGGLYCAYYVNDTTNQINLALGDEKTVSSTLLKAIFVFSFLSLATNYVNSTFQTFNDILNTVQIVSNITIWIMLIIWAFKVRNRVIEYCELDSNTYMWFFRIWTFIFAPLYFNYRLNCLVENMKHPDFIATAQHGNV